MQFVPEGDFVLRVSSAADSVVEYGEIPGIPAGIFTHNKILQSYLDAEQPLNVTRDLSGIVITMTAKLDNATKSENRPAAASFVSLLRKANDGTLQQVSNGLQDRFSGQQRTDDQGHYRVAALSPAEYLVVRTSRYRLPPLLATVSLYPIHWDMSITGWRS